MHIKLTRQNLLKMFYYNLFACLLHIYFDFPLCREGKKEERNLTQHPHFSSNCFFPFPETQNREAQLQMVDVCMEDSLSFS